MQEVYSEGEARSSSGRAVFLQGLKSRVHDKSSRLTVDQNAVHSIAVERLKADKALFAMPQLWQSKALSTVTEHDHRRLKG